MTTTEPTPATMLDAVIDATTVAIANVGGSVNLPAVTAAMVAHLGTQVGAGTTAPAFDAIPLDDGQLEFYDLGGAIIVISPENADRVVTSWQVPGEYAAPLWGKLRDLVIEVANEFTPKGQLTGELLVAIRLVLDGLATFELGGGAVTAAHVADGTYDVELNGQKLTLRTEVEPDASSVLVTFTGGRLVSIATDAA